MDRHNFASVDRELNQVHVYLHILCIFLKKIFQAALILVHFCNNEADTENQLRMSLLKADEVRSEREV